MSRSRKKHPIAKDKGSKNYNKRFRRVNRQRISQGLEPLLMKEVVNSYDVHDYIFKLYKYNEKEMLRRFTENEIRKWFKK